MAFRTGLTPAEALRTAKGTAAAIRKWWLGERNRFVSSDQDANTVLAVLDRVRGALAEWERDAAVPGIADYAREQYDDPNYDVVAEFTAMVAAAEDARDWIVTAWNANATGYLTLNPDGSRVIQTFTPAQLSGLVTEMDALAATITED